MDVQVGLLCVSVALLSAIVIYVISMSTMKEKTYDEAMADFKRQTEENFPQERNVKEKTKDKKDKKKAGKKVKEKNPVTSNRGSSNQESTGSESTTKTHVFFVEPEEVVDENVH